MSDDWLIVVPTAPEWVPDHEGRARVARLTRELVPLAWDIEIAEHSTVTFVSCFGNYESVNCPTCGSLIDDEFFNSEMARCWDESKFNDLGTTLPCCGGSLSLNDLKYEAPQAFARFHVSAWNPNRDWFDDFEMEQLGVALGHSVRQIFRHL